MNWLQGTPSTREAPVGELLVERSRPVVLRREPALRCDVDDEDGLALEVVEVGRGAVEVVDRDVVESTSELGMGGHLTSAASNGSRWSTKRREPIGVVTRAEMRAGNLRHRSRRHRWCAGPATGRPRPPAGRVEGRVAGALGHRLRRCLRRRRGATTTPPAASSPRRRASPSPSTTCATSAPTPSPTTTVTVVGTLYEVEHAGPVHVRRRRGGGGRVGRRRRPAGLARAPRARAGQPGHGPATRRQRALKVDRQVPSTDPAVPTHSVHGYSA